MRKLITVVLALLFALVVAALAFRTYRKLNVPGQPHAPIAESFGMEDFRDAIYYPPRAFLDGANPYHTERYQAAYPVRQVFPPYSPLLLLLHAPVTLVPFEPAEFAYFFFVVALAPVLAYVSIEYAGVRPSVNNVLGLSVLILASRASYINQTSGSMAMQLAIVSILALRFAQSRPWISGAALALASCKPTFGVPLAILMLCRRDFRAVTIGMALGAAGAIVAATILMITSGGPVEFIHSLGMSFAYFERHEAVSPTTGSGRLDATVILLRLLATSPAWAVKTLTPLVLIAVVGWTLVLLSRQRHRAGVESLSAVLIAMSVVAFAHHQTYDALLLFYPVTAIAVARQTPWQSLPGRWRWPLLALLAFPLYNYFTLQMLMVRLETGGLPWTVLSMLSGLALLAGLAVCLSLRTAVVSRQAAC